MKRTSAFTVSDGTVDPPVKLTLDSDESVVGWYRNPPPWNNHIILFTSAAIYLADAERIERIALSDIVGYESPKSKTDITGVRIVTKDGFRFVRIAGCFGPNGNRKDAFSFIMFIRNIVPRDPVTSGNDNQDEN